MGERESICCATRTVCRRQCLEYLCRYFRISSDIYRGSLVDLYLFDFLSVECIYEIDRQSRRSVSQQR